MDAKIPYFRQETDYTCGAACLRMVLAADEREHTEQEIADLLGARPGVGVDNDDLVACAERLGYTTIAKASSTIDDLKDALEHRYFVIVNYKSFENHIGHFGVLTEISDDMVFLHDPWDGERFTTTTEDFVGRWLGQYPRWFVALKPMS